MYQYLDLEILRLRTELCLLICLYVGWPRRAPSFDRTARVRPCSDFYIYTKKNKMKWKDYVQVHGPGPKKNSNTRTMRNCSANFLEAPALMVLPLNK